MSNSILKRPDNKSKKHFLAKDFAKINFFESFFYNVNVIRIVLVLNMNNKYICK